MGDVKKFTTKETSGNNPPHSRDRVFVPHVLYCAPFARWRVHPAFLADNMPELKIAPSILTADFGHLDEAVQAADHDGADLFHLDVMDGRFVPNLTFGPVVIEAVRRITEKTLDVHLMILEPERALEDYARAGANRLTVHWEASPHLHRTLGAIRELGLKAGVALNPHTPVEALYDILPVCDMVLIMSVNPGFGRQQFIPQAADRIERLNRMRAESGFAFEIVADGGINAKTAPTVTRAGADTLVIGSAIYPDGKYAPGSIPTLRSAAQAGRTLV